MLNVNANLFRIAAICQSNEQHRYYLCGVYIEPRAAGGVTMTATDGRYLVTIYDETGTCDKPVIVQLPKATLKSCKNDRKELEPRRLVMSDMGNAFVRYLGEDVGVASKCIVDGVFPDYRYVVKSVVDKPLGDGSPVCWNQECLRVLCDVSHEIQGNTGKKGIIIKGGTNGFGALVRFNDAPHAFGIVMPMLPNNKETELPSWHLEAETTKAA